MRAAVIPSAGADFVVKSDVPIPEPGPRQVRIHVHACGICHGDHTVKSGHYPGLTFPRIPGHEVAGVIAKLGPDVLDFKLGDRVAVGWFAGHCFQCEPCRRGNFVACKRGRVCGIHSDGGYAEYMIAPIEGLARIPDELSFIEAAPLVCAGLTVFNALRHSPAQAGDVVAVSGLGGLGHLGVQFANKMGFKVVALSSGADKKDLAKELGAHVYVDSSQEDPVKVLQGLGGARVILGTAPQSKVLSPLVGGLAPNGVLLIIGATAEPLQISPVSLIMGSKTVQGWASGISIDSEDTMKFAVHGKIRSTNEVFPLEKVNEAFAHMMTNKARFRVVLDLQKP